MLRKSLWILLLVVVHTTLFGVNHNIYSEGKSSSHTLAKFLAHGNKKLGKELTYEFADIYIDEAKKEGINWDVAFVQMCLETGFLKFGGLVEDGQNNFCGLGSFDSKKGASFPTIREGVRAHIQHLKAYSTTDDLKGTLIDPRFHLVQRGSAKNVYDLAGRWAEDPKYGVKLYSLLKRVDRLNSGDVVLRAEISAGYEPVKNVDITEVEIVEPVVMVIEKDKVEVVEVETKPAEDSVYTSEHTSEEESPLIGDGWNR